MYGIKLILQSIIIDGYVPDNVYILQNRQASYRLFI